MFWLSYFTQVPCNVVSALKRGSLMHSQGLAIYVYLPIYLSYYIPIYLSIYLSIYLPIYLPIYLSKYLSIRNTAHAFGTLKSRLSLLRFRHPEPQLWGAKLVLPDGKELTSEAGRLNRLICWPKQLPTTFRGRSQIYHIVAVYWEYATRILGILGAFTVWILETEVALRS